MTKNKFTKKSLISSILSLGLSCSMLIGTTFAWFTDTASVKVNEIVAGNLDVELVDADGKNIEGPLKFKDVKGNTENIKWEPGATYELQPIYIKNNGDIDLKYEINIKGIEGNTKQSNGGVNLLDVIEWTVKVGNKEVKLEELTGSLLAYKSSEALVISGHMKEDAGNEYKGKTLNSVSINVTASQIVPVVIEEGKTLAEAAVTETEAFQYYLINEDQYIGSGDSAEEINFNGSNITLDGGVNGTTITLSGNPSGYVWPGGANAPSGFNIKNGVNDVEKGSSMTFKNIDFVNKKDNSNSTTQANRATDYIYAYAENVVYENCTFDGGVVVYGNATFINCTFKETDNNRYCVFFDNEYGRRTGTDYSLINCTFEADKAYGCVKVADDEGVGATLFIKECTFKVNTTEKADVYVNGATAVTTEGTITYSGNENGGISAKDGSNCTLNGESL